MRILLVGFILFQAFCLLAQNAPFVISWGATDLSDSGIDVVQFSSGSIYTCGFAAQASGGTKVSLTKFDVSGNLLQEWFFGGTGHHVPYQMRIVNNELILVGRSEAASGDINGLLMRVDTLGNLLQWNTWGQPDRTEGFTTFDVFEDGGFAVGGFAGGWNGIGNDALAAKFNSSFQLMWLNISGYAENDAINGIAVIDGNHCVAAGDRDILNHHHNVFVIRYNEEGIEEWLYFEDNGYNGGSKAIMVNSQNEVVVVGESSGPGFDPFEPTFARYTADGELIMHTWIPSSSASDAIFSIIEPIPGSYLMCGYGFNTATESVDVVVYYTNNLGEEVEKRFYNVDAGSDIAFKIVESVNGGYLVSGRSGNFDNGNLLIYDSIVLVLSSNELNSDGAPLLCYPNPIAQNQRLNSNFDWHSAIAIDAQGKQVELNKNRSLQFANPGLYIVKFYNEVGAELGTARVLCY